MLEVVRKQNRFFRLADVLNHADELQRRYPANRFVDAKIRQSLQTLRDQGALKFFGGGLYERLDVEPHFSPFFDSSIADAYANRAQVARVLIETWAELNLYCLTCASDSLERLPGNTPVADFDCFVCSTRYQIKSKDGRMGPTIIGAAYQPTIEAIRAGAFPELVLVEFDGRRSSVVYVDAVPGRSIVEDRVIARRPLGPRARRAGWQGCTIDVGGLPSVSIVAPLGADRQTVRRQWSEIAVARLNPTD